MKQCVTQTPHSMHHNAACGLTNRSVSPLYGYPTGAQSPASLGGIASEHILLESPLGCCVLVKGMQRLCSSRCGTSRSGTSMPPAEWTFAIALGCCRAVSK